MTLIFSFLGNTLLCGGDIIISQEGKNPNPVKIPSNAFPISYTNGDDSIVDICRKSYIINENALILWAGVKILARTIIKYISESISDGYFTDIDDAADKCGFTEAQKDKISIILIFHHGGKRIRTLTYNCAPEPYQRYTVSRVGTGSWHFFDEEIPNSFGGEQSELLIPICAATRMILMEGANEDSLRFMYGGWIELFGVEPEGFRRIPYSIKVWEFKENRLLDFLPIIFSDRAQKGLSIYTIDERNVISTARLSPPDIFGRVEFDPIPPSFEFDFEVHAIFKNGSPGLMICPWISERALSYSIDSNGQIKSKINSEKKQALLNMVLAHPWPKDPCA